MSAQTTTIPFTREQLTVLERVVTRRLGAIEKRRDKLNEGDDVWHDTPTLADLSAEERELRDVRDAIWRLS